MLYQAGQATQDIFDTLLHFSTHIFHQRNMWIVIMWTMNFFNFGDAKQQVHATVDQSPLVLENQQQRVILQAFTRKLNQLYYKIVHPNVYVVMPFLAMKSP